MVTIRFMPDADEVAALREWLLPQKVDGAQYMTLLEMVNATSWELDIEVQGELVRQGVLKRVRCISGT